MKYYCGELLQGHVRVGRALLCKNKAQQAVKAFSNAFNALDMDATDLQKKDILKELVKTVTTHLGKVLVSTGAVLLFWLSLMMTAFHLKHGSSSSVDVLLLGVKN